MPTQFSEGRYLVRIVNQYFTEAKTGTRGFVLTFRALHNLDQPEAPVKSYQRNTTWWISKNNAKRVMHDLHTLGYEGKDFTGVDPDEPDFHDFKDQEIELICSHETTSSGVFESWNLLSAPPRLRDKSKLRELNRLLETEQERANGDLEVVGLGITDEDVPF